MPTTTPHKPQVDPAPLHNCGTLYRAGVITRGCPGCRQRSHTARPA